MITLENSTGIATLTSLGNNQYKITRNGSASGNVTLKSVTTGNAVSKTINVGTPSPAVNGASNVNTMGTFHYSISSGTAGSSVEYSVMAPASVVLNEISNTQFSLNFTEPNTSGGTQIIRVRITETNSCGTIQIIKNIGYLSQ